MVKVCFQQPKVVIPRPWIETFGRNLLCKQLLAFLKARRHKTRKQTLKNVKILAIIIIIASILTFLVS